MRLPWVAVSESQSVKILDRHIRNTVLMSIFVLIALIAAIDLVFSMAEEFSDTSETYTLLNASIYVLFNTPTRLYELLPFAVLGGALVGLGVLASHNEILVMQAASIRVRRIVWAVLKPAMMIMILNLIVGEFIAPPLEQIGQSNKALQRSGSGAINSSLGTWQKIGNEFIHINAIAPGGELLYGVARYRIDDERRLAASSFAESAQYISEGSGGYWRLNNVRETLFEPQRLTTTTNLQVDWQIDLSPNLLSVLIMAPDRQSMTGLYRFSRFFEDEGLDATEYVFAFWKKLLQPVATFALVILAISFVFGPLRESTMGMRVFVAIVIGIGFTIVQRMMEPVSLLYGFSPLMAVLTPILMALVCGLILLRRVR